jgi:16S rRNA C1402 N4-methylase RsmH
MEILHTIFKLYFEKIFKDKTFGGTGSAKRILMAVNIHIAASSLTNAGFALATASFVATGINLNLELSALAGRRAGEW